MRDWQHQHLSLGPKPKHDTTIEEQQALTVSLREVIHYTYDGITCCDCRTVLSLYPASPYLPETAVVMLDRDPRATWVTTLRKPNCLKR